MRSRRGNPRVRAGAGGFTLIELLIVVVIVGILAAVAVPQFSGTKEQALASRMKADLHNIAAAQEQYYADSTSYAPSVDALTGVSVSSGVDVPKYDSGIGWWAVQLGSDGTDFTCEMAVGENATELNGGPTTSHPDSLGRALCKK